MKKRATPGPGHPVTTGSDSTPVTAFRLSAIDHARLVKFAKATGATTGVVARVATLAAIERHERTSLRKP